MWCSFGSCIFESSRSKIACAFLLFDSRTVCQLNFKEIEVLIIYSPLGQRYLAYVTHPHDWRLWWLKEKNPQWGEKSFELIPACKNLVSQVKTLADAWHVSMLVCMYHKCKCLWRGRLMSVTVSLWSIIMFVVFLLSNIIMLTYICMKPWVFNSRKFVIVQVSQSYRLLVCSIIPI